MSLIAYVKIHALLVGRSRGVGEGGTPLAEKICKVVFDRFPKESLMIRLTVRVDPDPVIFFVCEKKTGVFGPITLF